MQLSEKIRLRELEIRNRIWLPPMCQYQARERDGMPGMWHAVHYGARAAGGFGLIIAEASGVVPEGRISPFCTGIWSDAHAKAWAPIVEFAHKMGAAMGIQLGHAGRKASTYPMLPDNSGRGTIPVAEGGWGTRGPSAIAADGQETPRAMTLEEVRAVPGQFADAARHAVNAGFDCVEIHGAHGYLLHQFLSPMSNTREDEYGGDFNGRTRLLLEVVEAVRAAIPEGMPLLVRLSATDWVEPEGWRAEDSERLAPLLRDAGVDLIDVSTGGNVRADIPVGPGYQVDFARRVREASGLPTAAVGMILSSEQAQQVLDDGAADAVLIGRPALRNAEWALDALEKLGVPEAELPWPESYFRGWAGAPRG